MKNGSLRGQNDINTYSKLWSLRGHFFMKNGSLSGQYI